MRVPRGGVAFFDSGIGGLTVMAACKKECPQVDFYYYGDNRHAPYGNLPAKKIKRYVFRVFRKFEKWKVSAAVLACNTATAVCVEELRARFSFPIIGTEPAVFLAAKEGGRIFALSTRATYESDRYQKLCQRAGKKYPFADIQTYACDALAGEIEKSLGKEGVDFTVYLPRGAPKSVVLGCTHYPYIKEQIEEFYHCKTVDGNEGVARRLKAVLAVKNSPQKGVDHSRPPTPRFYPQRGGVKEERRRKGEKRLLRQKLNKRSFFIFGKKAQSQESKGEGRIVFLGSDKKRNKKTFKQMFA